MLDSVLMKSPMSMIFETYQRPHGYPEGSLQGYPQGGLFGDNQKQQIPKALRVSELPLLPQEKQRSPSSGGAC